MGYFAFVTNAKDGTVSTFTLDDDGTLARVAVSEVGAGCSTLVVEPGRRRVHVAVKGENEPAIVTTSIGDDGSLTEHSRRHVADGLQYLALTRDGSTMLAASYGGGYGVTFGVDEDGVGEPIARVEHANVHSCAVSNDARTAYFVSLGEDLIAQCSLDNGNLTPLDPPTAPAPAGSGPRHIVLNASEESVYVMTEFSGQVLHYRRAGDGTLEQAGGVGAFDPSKGLRHSRFGADPAAEHLIWGADIHLSPDQHALWASERTASTLATIPIANTTLREAVQFIGTEQQPRGFAVTPDGRFLLCTGELSREVSLFGVRPDKTLQFLAGAETGNGANWVRFLER